MNKLPIREWAAEDRPREKMIHKGASALSDAELLAILIGSGNRAESAVQLSRRLLHSVGNSLEALGRLPVKGIIAGFKGIGEAKAVSIAAALELARRRNGCERFRQDSITCSRDVYTLFYPLLCDLDHEEFWIALTNQAARVIDKVKISQGGVSGTDADIRLILKAAIQSLACGIILCHNHPSGNVRPSLQDDSLTFRMQASARLMGMRLSDHLIVSAHDYYSYADEGMLKED